MLLPQISVIMSVYNNEKYLNNAIDSILNQTFADFEFLITDDGSTDHSRNILMQYENKDNRIRLFFNDKNIGLTRSLNRTIEKAQGQWIARMDADDISLPHRLEKEFKYFISHSDIRMISTLSGYIDENGNPYYPPDANKSIPNIPLKELLLKKNIFSHGAAMFDRDFFYQTGGYRESFRYSQDYDLWLRMMEHGKLELIQEILYIQRLTFSSISGEKALQQFAYAELARRCSELRRRGKQDTDYLIQESEKIFHNKSDLIYCSGYPWLTTGLRFLEQGDRIQARKYISNAIKIKPHPFVKSILDWTLTFLPYRIYKKIRRFIQKISTIKRKHKIEFIYDNRK